jgi:hypothetical protein
MFAPILPTDFPQTQGCQKKHHKNFLSFSSLSLSLSLSSLSLSVSIQNHGTIIDDDSIVLIDEDIDSSIET